MSNSPLITYTKLSKYRQPRKAKIDTISIHCMAGNGSLAGIGSVFNGSRIASSNYAVDSKGRVGMYVPENYRSYCTSSGSNDHRAITIEVANDGGADTGWHVSKESLEGLIELLVDICKRNGIKKLLWKNDKSLIGQIDKQNMTVHRWFANKSCPGDYLMKKHPYIAEEVNKRLGAKEDKPKENISKENNTTSKYPTPPFLIKILGVPVPILSEPKKKAKVNAKVTNGVYTVIAIKNKTFGRTKGGLGFIDLVNPNIKVINK